MATLDEGVVNLQRFIGQLVNAISALGQVDDHLEAKAKAFDELEKAAGDDGDGLGTHLQEATAALDTGVGEAEQALADMGHAATAGAATLGEAEDSIGQTATDLEAKAQAALHDLDAAQAALTQSGFDALGHTLEEAEQELQKEQQESDQQVDALEAAAQGFQGEAESAFHEAEGALETATAALAQQESAVEADGAEGVHALESAASEMESHCTSLQGELEAIYAVVTQGVDSQGHEWEQAVQELGQGIATFVQDGQEHRLDAPATMLHDEALGALGREYDTLGAVLDVASATAGMLEPLGEELVRSQTVVVQVDELMNALAG